MCAEVYWNWPIRLWYVVFFFSFALFIISDHLWSNSAHSLHCIWCDSKPVYVWLLFDWRLKFEWSKCFCIVRNTHTHTHKVRNGFTSWFSFVFDLSDSLVVFLLFLITTIRFCSWAKHVCLLIWKYSVMRIRLSTNHGNMYHHTIAMLMRKMFQRNLCDLLTHSQKKKERTHTHREHKNQQKPHRIKWRQTIFIGFH